MRSCLNERVAASINGRWDPLADHATLFSPQKLTLTSLTRGVHSVGILLASKRPRSFWLMNESVSRNNRSVKAPQAFDGLLAPN
jgi:hypothetical protein